MTTLPKDLAAHEIGPGLAGFWRALPREGRFLLSTVALQHLGRGMTLPFTVIYLHEVRHFSLDAAGTIMALLALVAALGLADAPLRPELLPGALAAGQISPWIRRHRRIGQWQGRVVGTIYIALGIRLAFQER